MWCGSSKLFSCSRRPKGRPRPQKVPQDSHQLVLSDPEPEKEFSSPLIDDDSPSSTFLQMEVQMPWLDTFELGQGIDALTGAPKGTAFLDLNWSAGDQPKDHKSTATSQVIHQLHELHHDVQIGAAVTVNSSSPVSVGTSFDYLRSRALSSTSFMIEYKINGQYGFERPPRDDFKLTPAAMECLNDPTLFRERYGDYFIYGFQRGYSFHTLIHYAAQQEEDIRSTEAKAKAYVDGLFGLGGNAGTSNKSSSSTTVESTYVMQRGCVTNSDQDSTSTVSLDAAAQMARTVRGTTQPGVHQIALLKHYSFLFPSVTNEVQVPESAFSAVRDLGNIAARLELDCLHAAILPEHRKKMGDIVNRFRAKQPSLVKDKTARELIGKELYSAMETTTSLIRQSSLVQGGLQSQPDEEVKSRRHRSRWEYGVNPQRPIDGSKKCQQVKIPGRETAYQCYLVAKVTTSAAINFRFVASPSPRSSDYDPPNECIVSGYATIIGWTLSCDNTDSEKVSFTRDGGIDENWLEIRAESPRGREWHCRVTFVGTLYSY